MKKLMSAVAMLLCLATQLPPAHALAITLSSRSDLKIHGLENVFLDITVSGLRSGGLNTTLGGYELNLLFDPTLFQLLNVPPAGWGTGLGSVFGGEALGRIVLTAPGVLHVSEVSLLEASAAGCSFCTGPYLEDLQSDSFRLATIGLYAYNPAFPSRLSIVRTDQVVLGDGAGNRLPGVPNSALQFTIAEPGSLSLMALGLASAAALARRRHTLRRRPSVTR